MSCEGKTPDPAAQKTASAKNKFMRWLPEILLFGAGSLFRLEYLREFAQFPHFYYTIGADIAEYTARANEILAGKLMPETLSIHAPLYPLCMAAVWLFTGESALVLRIVQILLNLAAWFVIFLTAGKYRIPKKIRYLFLGAAMFAPGLIYHQAELISESLLIPLLAISFLLFYRYDKSKKRVFLLLSGAAAALTVLTHGLMLSFVCGISLALFIRRKAVTAWCFTAAVAAVLLGATAVNSIYYKQLSGIQGNSAFNIFLGNNPRSTGGCYLRPYKEWRDFHKAIEVEAKQKNISENQLYWQKVIDFHRNDPAALLKLTGKKFLMLFAPWEIPAGADPGAFVLLTPIQNFTRFIPFILLGLTLTGIVVLVRKRELLKKYLFILLPTAALAAALVLTVVSGRYRIGMMPGIFLLSAIGFCNLKRIYIVVLTILAAAAAIFLHPGKTLPHEAASITAEVLMKQKQYDEAEKLIIFAMQALDDPSRFNNMLGNIAELRGDFKRAEKEYRAALAAENDQFITYLNLGQLLFRDRSRRIESCRLLRASLHLNPAQSAAWNFLGIDNFENKRIAEAAACFANAHRFNPGNPGYKRNFEICQKLLQAQK